MTSLPFPFDQSPSIPASLRELSTLVVALISDDGLLIDANQGFLLLANLPQLPAEPWHVHNLFLSPGFFRLAGALTAGDGVYQGILNIGDINGLYHSVHGRVCRAEGKLLVIAEPDVHELSFLNRQVVKMNEEMAEMSRELFRKNSELERQRETLRQFNETLEQRVAEEVAQRVAQERMLIQQSRLAVMGEMINNIIHQWRQPLNTLSMLAHFIQEESSRSEASKAELAKHAQDMMSQIQAMADTIEDFRNFFKPNKIQRDFHLQDAVDDLLTLSGHTLKAHKVRIQVKAEADAIVTGYPNEFAQVLVNLVNNASEAMVDRAISGGEVLISIGHDETHGWIAIQDNAGGIPEHVLPNIFDPYFSTKGGGTGIGLYMSRLIMENMHGEITARNVGCGAEFKVILPLKWGC